MSGAVKAQTAANTAEAGIQRADFTLRGRSGSPLVVHAFAEKAKQEIRDKQQKKAKKAKEQRDPKSRNNLLGPDGPKRSTSQPPEKGGHRKMSERTARMISDLDAEIAALAAESQHLIAARKELVATSSPHRARHAHGSVISALLQLMQDGESWHVARATEALNRGGLAVTRETVNCVVNRGTKNYGPFERVGRGVYRLRGRDVSLPAPSADSHVESR